LIARTRSETDGYDFAAVVEATVRAQVVGALELATIVALVEGFDLQRIMRAPIATAMRRNFSFWDSHGGTCSYVEYSIFKDRP
jgi:hypothetical protein|tara:strand:+ start:133 stop:381 length:249 start_codon:yes stop_codon:yes gene_type:complete